MNPLLWNAAAWGTVSSLIGATAAVLAVFTAHRGLSTWRKQENFKIDIELARNIIRSKHALRRSIVMASKLGNDLCFESEYYNQLEIALNAISRERSDLLALSAEARVLWGFNQRRIFDLLERISDLIDRPSETLIVMINIERKLLTAISEVPDQENLPSDLVKRISEARRDFSTLWERLGSSLNEARNIYEEVSQTLDDILAARLGR